MDNLVGQLVPEKKSDSFVVSAPDNKLQQERVISQTYTIKEEPEFKQTESNWQYSKQGEDAPDLTLKGRAIQSFNDDDKDFSNKYTTENTNNYTGSAYETKYESKF